MKLRDYELDWLRRIRRASARRVLVVGPTGSGKTVVAAALMRGALDRGHRVLFVVHRRELVKQAVQRLRESGVAQHAIGVILGGGRVGDEIYTLAERPHARIQVASIQTLNRARAPNASIVLIDEAHHATAKTYRALLAHYPKANVYGLTATPYRLDGRPLGDLFEEIVSAPPASDLIAARWLMRPRVYTVPYDQRPDLSGVRVFAGDFSKADLARAVNRKVLVGNIVDHYVKHAGSRSAVCYAVNVEHGEHIVASFDERGIDAELLTGDVPLRARVEILARFATGTTRVIVNCMVLTEGWDCPEAKLAIVARPTLSTCLWMQMCGRITRPTDGEATPTPLVLDHAGNAHVHGLPLEDVSYSLHGTRVRAIAKPGSLPEKLCPICECALPIGARECSNCGHEFSASEISELEGKLVLATRVVKLHNHCQYEHCLTPGKPVLPQHGKPGLMHMACIRARSAAARCCQYEHCPTPNRRLSKRRHIEHRVCAKLRRALERQPVVKIKRVAEHGTRSKYTAGCRCERCRAASSAYQRAYYRRCATHVPP